VLEQANIVTVISPSMAKDFRELHDRPYEVITNGYDDADTIISSPPEKDRKFSIAHIGTLTGSRNPVILWNVISELVKSLPGMEKDLEIKLVGKVDHSVTTSLESMNLSGFVRRIEYLPHNEIARVQQQAQVLLLLINNTPNAKSILTGKFFEYMASGRPVLAIGPVDGDAAQLLKETGSGLISGFEDPEGTRKNILHFYELFKENKLEIAVTNTSRFSRRELTGKMATILDRMISK
jgi:glycosyltransferase involved in cell wall biosynthesis